MRLLHVYSGNLYGGIEAILIAIARHRDACPGLDSEFALCFDGRLSQELTDAGVRVHVLPSARVSRPQSLHQARRALAAILATERFDRVVCHAAWSHAIFGPVVRAAGIPLVVWVHDVLTGRHWTERWARRTPPDLAICNSRFTAQHAKTVYVDAPVAVVYAPVETAAGRLSNAERATVRAELETPSDSVVIVHASRMEPWKGHARLLDALAELRDRSDWVCWLVGGAQRPHEVSYVDSLREMAGRLEIGRRVRFVGQRNDVGRLLAAADIHCQPNLSPEPFGMAFIEALAAGLPVVTTDLGGAVEIVDESCGLLVAAEGGVHALTDALGRLIEDGTMRARLADGAPVRARRLCDPAAQIARLAQVLNDLPAVQLASQYE